MDELITTAEPADTGQVLTAPRGRDEASELPRLVPVIVAAKFLGVWPKIVYSWIETGVIEDDETVGGRGTGTALRIKRPCVHRLAGMEAS